MGNLKPVTRMKVVVNKNDCQWEFSTVFWDAALADSSNTLSLFCLVLERLRDTSTHTQSSQPAASLSTDDHRLWDLETFHFWILAKDASQWCTRLCSNLQPQAARIKSQQRKRKRLISWNEAVSMKKEVEVELQEDMYSTDWPPKDGMGNL